MKIFSENTKLGLCHPQAPLTVTGSDPVSNDLKLAKQTFWPGVKRISESGCPCVPPRPTTA